jgi:hypothetical protein
MVIRRFGVWSVARLGAAVYGALGLIIGMIVALVSLVAAGVSTAVRQEMMTPAAGIVLPAFFGVGAIIVLPIVYGILGMIGGALTAALYNLFAGWVGGVEMDVQ